MQNEQTDRASSADLADALTRAAARVEKYRRQVLIEAVVRAVLSLGLQTAGVLVIWHESPALAAGILLLLWGYGIGLRAIFKTKAGRGT